MNIITRIKFLYISFIAKLNNAWRSWTIWLNSLMAITMLSLPDLQQSFPQLQTYLPEHIYKYAMLVIISANIILRFKTVQDLAVKGK